MIIIIAALFITIPFSKISNPTSKESIWNYTEMNNHDYMTVTIEEMYYTGYDIKQFAHPTYSYYYTIKNNICMFVLIPKEDATNETLSNYTITGKLIKHTEIDSFSDMTQNLAKALGWRQAGLIENSAPFVLDNSDYNPTLYLLIFALLIFGIFYSLTFVFSNVRLYLHPTKYNICPHFRLADTDNLIEKIDYELTKRVRLQVNDLYLTKHFFVECSKRRLVVVPLDFVIWIYRIGSGNLTKEDKSPAFNLVFTLNSGDDISFFDKPSETTRLILEELRKMNFDFIIGYSETKRKMVDELINK